MTKNILNMNDNKWKYLSFALMAIIAVPAVSNVIAPEAFAAVTDSILTIVKDIQSKVNSSVFGLQAIKTAVDTKASQTSVNTLQTGVSAINAKTNNLPANPASTTDVTSAVTDIGQVRSVETHLDIPDGDRHVIIPHDYSEKTASGHITGLIRISSGATVVVECGTADNVLTILQFSADSIINEDFACNGFYITHVGGGTVGIQTVTQYVLSSNTVVQP